MCKHETIAILLEFVNPVSYGMPPADAERDRSFGHMTSKYRGHFKPYDMKSCHEKKILRFILSFLHLQGLQA